jgi:hypothetical protein
MASGGKKKRMQPGADQPQEAGSSGKKQKRAPGRSQPPAAAANQQQQQQQQQQQPAGAPEAQERAFKNKEKVLILSTRGVTFRCAALPPGVADGARIAAHAGRAARQPPSQQRPCAWLPAPPCHPQEPAGRVS